MQALVPEIESNIKMPPRSSREVPELNPHQEVTVRANTIKHLCDLKGEPIIATEDTRDQAEELAKQMVENPALKPEFSNYPNNTIAYLAGLVSQMNCMIVKDLAELKMYVVNKLVAEAESATSSRDRIAALKSLGDIDGVDAFKKRTETTITIKPIEEVEKELLTVLDNIEYSVVGIKSEEEEEEEEYIDEDEETE